MKLVVDKQDIKEITKLKGFHLLSHQRRKKKIVKLVQETILPGSDILDAGARPVTLRWNCHPEDIDFMD